MERTDILPLLFIFMSMPVFAFVLIIIFDKWKYGPILFLIVAFTLFITHILLCIY